MAKAKKTVFFCQNCGHEEAKWLGQCPVCKEWNTFVEEKKLPEKGSESGIRRKAEPISLSRIETKGEERIRTEMEELDRVLGGGIVKGSLVLVGGDPGIGKSTLLLQVCRILGEKGEEIIYISGEESLTIGFLCCVKRIWRRSRKLSEQRSRILRSLTPFRQCTARRLDPLREVCPRCGRQQIP